MKVYNFFFKCSKIALKVLSTQKLETKVPFKIKHITLVYARKKYNFPWMGYNNGWPKWWHLTNHHSLLFKFDVYGWGWGNNLQNFFGCGRY